MQAEETRLGHVTEDLREAQTIHGEWVEAINVLTGKHEQKTGELQRLAAAAENALREIETVSTHKEETLAHLKQLREVHGSIPIGKRMGLENDPLDLPHQGVGHPMS